jgi:hypothetical protein
MAALRDAADGDTVMAFRIAVIVAIVWAAFWYFGLRGAWVGPSNHSFAAAIAFLPAAGLVGVTWLLTRWDVEKFVRSFRRR